MVLKLILPVFLLFSADTEVFKVKKSSHSKRIAKQLKRERERDEKLEKEEKAKLEKNNPNKRSDSDEERAREEELKVNFFCVCVGVLDLSAFPHDK